MVKRFLLSWAAVDPGWVFLGSLLGSLPGILDPDVRALPFGWALIAGGMFGPLLFWILLRAWSDLLYAMRGRAGRPFGED